MNRNEKVALVTGSSRGIGRAIALELAGKGRRLVVHGSRESEALREAFEQVKTLSPESICVAANLADSGAIRVMFARIQDTFDRLDVLVNNAATQKPSPLLDLEEKDWDFVLAVNLKAPYLCGRLAGLMMREQHSGKIVNITSVHAKDPKRNFAHYSSSKGGLETLTKVMALELAQYNIQVNSVMAGAIATDMTPLDRSGKLVTAIPAGRIGTVEEVARLVSFLVSEACDYLTGASITVDGGLTLGFCASRPDL